MDGFKCAVCSSRRFIRDAQLQTVMCHRGHVMTNYREECADEDSAAISGRTMAKKKGAGIATTEKDKLARSLWLEHLLLHVQDLLISQIDHLVLKANFPKEIDREVRDLWLLYINCFDADLLSRQDGGSISLEAYRTYQGKISRLSRFHGKTQRLRTLSPHFIIPLCYLGSIRMRIPVILNDFVRWANSGSIPYMCDRNKYIPECCNMGLADVNKYFDTKEFPCLTGVSKDEKAFRSLFRKQYNLTFPGINIPAFWARSISILGVPDHVYTDTYCLSYLASGWKWENIGLSEDHLSLLALVVISIKLRYGSVGDDGIFDISIKINSEPCMPFTHMLYNKNIIDTLSIDDRMQYVQEYASKAIKGLNLETASGEKNIVKVIDSHIKYNPLKESEETPPCEQQVEALSDASKYAIIEKRDMAMIGRNYNRLLAKCVLFLGCDVKTFRHAILTIEKRIHWKKQWVLSFID